MDCQPDHSVRVAEDVGAEEVGAEEVGAEDVGTKVEVTEAEGLAVGVGVAGLAVGLDVGRGSSLAKA